MPRAKSGSVKLEDIARATGLGRATVARCLSPDNRYAVAPATREAVLAVARKLGYRTTSLGRKLSTGRTRMVGIMYAGESPMVVGSLAETFVNIPRTLTRFGYQSVLVPVQADQPDAWRRQIAEDGLEGCLVLPPLVPELTAEMPVPTILVNLRSDHGLSSVLPDDRGGLAMLIGHLVALGHRDIAFHHGALRNDHVSADERETGYRSAMADAGLQPRILVEPPARTATAWAAGPRPTAVATYSHIVGVELLSACQAAGLAVPRDLSIATCNDTWPTAVVHPPLTTVRIPAGALGIQAARLLVQMLEQGSEGPPPSITLPEELVVRASTAAPTA